ncbi:MAG: glycosyltransferase family 4 protein [Sphaerobacteraceae bacterium]|nr:MAG: glycosyltransferase family 4 protein [Sphaerobacteraceae bacterium]
MSEPRIALSHDYLNQYGGAERVVEVFHAMFPDAPVYTSIYDAQSMPPDYRQWDIRTSFLQRIPGIHKNHQPFLPLYPAAFKFLTVDPAYDVLLSSSSAWGKGVRVDPSVLHICYCHSPMRFAWDFEHYAERERMDGMSRRVVQPILRRLRNWDRATSKRVHQFIANSAVVQERIATFWGRQSIVVHPPVDTESFEPAPPSEIGDYYVLVSRLVPYKRFDLAIEAANSLGIQLKIIGDGRARADLESMAGPTVEFLGRVSDAERNQLFARCKAAIFPAEDDFGIGQVEVQAAGRPVIALDRGGARETVLDGETGVRFAEQTASGVADAIRRFEQLTFDPERIVSHASRFSRARFEREISRVIDDAYARHTDAAGSPSRVSPGNL